MTTRARLCLVSTRCLPEIGGIESHVAEVASRLAARGVVLEVLTTDRSGDLRRVERTDGYVVRRFRAYPRTRDWYLSPGLFWTVLRGRYDLVHVQGVHTLVAPLAMLAALLRRVPYALTFHTGGSSSAFRERARAVQFRLLAPMLRRASALVGVSRFEARRFEDVLSWPAGAIPVVRNGGTLPLAEARAADLDLVVSVGRLERYKGHHRAIAALPVLLRTRPDARLLVLGCGPYEAELRALAVRLQVADRVEVEHIPAGERRRMAERLAGAGVVLLLSDYEAHPVSVMEALDQGLPVVVRRTSGLTELEELGWAIGVPADAAPEEVARAIEQQLTAPREVVRTSLPTWETCVEQLVEVYDSCLTSTASSHSATPAMAGTR